jgi:hypothetical protein
MFRGMKMAVVMACVALCVLNAPAGIVMFNDGSFSYQGYMEENGEPANGMYSFRFEAFNDPVGFDIASEFFFISAPVAVVDGLFVVNVQMGGSLANAQQFWKTVGNQDMYLEIGVGMFEGGPYETLGARVPMGWGARAQYSGFSEALIFPYTDSFTDESFDPTTMVSLTSVAGGTVLEANVENDEDEAIIAVNSANPGGLDFGSQTGGVHIDVLGRRIGLISIANEYAIAGILTTASGTQNTAVLGQVNAGVTGADAIFALNSDSGTRAYLGTPEYAGLFDGSMRVTDEATRDFTAGNPSPIGPLAYGSVSTAGNVTAGTGNLSASWDAVNSWYTVFVAGETIAFNTHTVTVTVVDGFEPRLATFNTAGGVIRVHIWDLNSGNIAVQDNFSIVIHDSDPVVLNRTATPDGVDMDKYTERTGEAIIRTTPRYTPVQERVGVPVGGSASE